jgi:hypothetical protein
MKFYQEVTQWPGDTVKNGVYYLNDSKTHAVGFIASGETALKIFKAPIRIETRGRKFQLLDRVGEPDSVYFGEPEKQAPVAALIEVSGSNGKKYFITGQGNVYQCTCSGFQFRRKCKHVDNINQKVKK